MLCESLFDFLDHIFGIPFGGDFIKYDLCYVSLHPPIWWHFEALIRRLSSCRGGTNVYAITGQEIEWIRARHTT